MLNDLLEIGRLKEEENAMILFINIQTEDRFFYIFLNLSASLAVKTNSLIIYSYFN